MMPYAEITISRRLGFIIADAAISKISYCRISFFERRRRHAKIRHHLAPPELSAIDSASDSPPASSAG